MKQIRYNFHTISCGIKEKSNSILEEMIEHSEKTSSLYIKRFKSLIVDKFACVKGKTGIVRQILFVGNRVLVWLEIQLTRGRVIHYGIEI